MAASKLTGSKQHPVHRKGAARAQIGPFVYERADRKWTKPVKSEFVGGFISATAPSWSPAVQDSSWGAKGGNTQARMALDSNLTAARWPVLIKREVISAISWVIWIPVA